MLRHLCATIGAAVALGSCGGGDGVTPPPPPPPSAVASVSVTPDVGALLVGASLQLTATVRDAAGNSLTGRSVVWTGDNAAVAAVSATGLVTAISAGGPVRITATSESRSATATVTVGSPGSGVIGPEGGTVATPTGGITVTFTPGAVSGVVSIEVRDTQSVSPRYASLSNRAVRLIIPLTGGGSLFRSGGSVRVTIPITRDVQFGATGYVRARFKGVEGEYWAPGISTGDRKLILDLPTSGFNEYKTLLGLDILDVLLDAEEFVASGGATLRTTPGRSNFLSGRAPNFLENCPSLPTGGSAALYASCAGGRLLKIVGSGSGESRRMGIVLVHGWDLNVANWVDYYNAQGLCALYLGGVCGLVVPPTPNPGRRLPGTAYFQYLLNQIGSELSARYDGAALYVFDYQSYRAYQESGQQLADSLLNAKGKPNEVDGFILVGHSMGGLVSRVAAQILEGRGETQVIRGIITLATPHAGTPLPAQLIAQVWGGVRSEGGQSLLNGLPRNERVSLVAYAGNIKGVASAHPLYSAPWATLCQLLFTPYAGCDNDGVVAVSSAQPEAFVGVGSVTFPTVLSGYDHSQLGYSTGASGDPGGAIGLYSSLASNLSSLLRRSGVTSIAFGDPLGGGLPGGGTAGTALPSVRVTVRDALGNPLLTPALRVGIHLGINPAVATLSGTLVVDAIGGVATFSDLSIDRAGSGFALVASAVGLSATSSPFTINPAPPGTIVTTPATSSFSATAGAAIPASQAIAITTGGGALTGLSVGTVSYTGTPGWLATPTLSSSTTPSALTLRPNTTSLAAGTYSATVQLTSAGATSSSVNVTYTVSASALLPPPSLTAPPDGSTGSSTTPMFTWSGVSGANRYWLMIATSPNAFPTDPAANSCPGCVMDGFTSTTGHTLPNAFPNGGSAIVGLSAGTTYYWKVQAFNNSITPNTQGQYSATSSFTTASAGAPSITLDRTTVPFTYTVGGSLPALQSVSITNGGSGTLNGLSISGVTYAPGQPTGWLNPALTTTTAPTSVSFVVLPASLGMGNYSATIQLLSTAPGVSNSPRTITVTLAVSAAATAPTIALSSVTATFNATAGGNNPAPQNTIQVSNSGTGNLTGLALGTITYQAGQPTGWLVAALTSTNAPSNVLLSASTGTLPAGTYTATIPITSSASGVTNSGLRLTVTFNVSTPRLIFVRLSAGADRTCGTTQSGESYCWGRNHLGQLGDGTTTDRTVPTLVAGGHLFVEIRALSYGHTCGRTQSGTALCWGRNADGQLGDGTTADRLIPTPVSGGISFSEISVGFSKTCGRSVAGPAYCWGHNSFGDLGDGTTADRLLPTQVAGGLTFAEIAAEGGNTCGRTQVGELYCWGYNFNGTVGDGTQTDRLIPSLVVGGITFVELSAGSNVCGRTQPGMVYCWQGGPGGMNGDGTENFRTTPTLVVGGVTYSEVSVGGSHVCGLTFAGAAFCWGANGWGAVGDGSAHLEPSLSPTPVVGGITFTTISAGGDHTCGLAQNGDIFCWGKNGWGELGIGARSFLGQGFPTRVVSP